MDMVPDEGPLTPVGELFIYHIFGLPEVAGRYLPDAIWPTRRRTI